MQHPYLLPREHHAIPLAALRCRGGNNSAALRLNDPAMSVMVDLERDPFLTVTEDTDLERALDGMFRLGVRLFLVVRASTVVGVLSIQDARRPSAQSASAGRAGAAIGLRVGDAMVPCAQVPAIDWQVLHQCSIADLEEIFAGCGAHYLVVLEDETPHCSRLRGLIARERLERALGRLQLD